jgi:hypothetical protein
MSSQIHEIRCLFVSQLLRVWSIVPVTPLELRCASRKIAGTAVRRRQKRIKFSQLRHEALSEGRRGSVRILQLRPILSILPDIGVHEFQQSKRTACLPSITSCAATGRDFRQVGYGTIACGFEVSNIAIKTVNLGRQAVAGLCQGMATFLESDSAKQSCYFARSSSQTLLWPSQGRRRHPGG